MIQTCAQVTIEDGVPVIDVSQPGIVIEVRDYDSVEDYDPDDTSLWVDELGKKCVRYFVDEDGECDPKDMPDEEALRRAWMDHIIAVSFEKNPARVRETAGTLCKMLRITDGDITCFALRHADRSYRDMQRVSGTPNANNSIPNVLHTNRGVPTNG